MSPQETKKYSEKHQEHTKNPKQENPQTQPIRHKSQPHTSTSIHPNPKLCCPHSDTPYIGQRQQAPEWMHYPDLIQGYRINFSTFKLILKSLFLLHNETINVWTHLIGVIILLLTAYFTCTSHLNSFQNIIHTPMDPVHLSHPIGSGKSFCQNITQTCLNESLIWHNSQSIYALSHQDQLAYDLCQNQQNVHECYLKKSQQKQFRNWVEFHSGISMEKLQQFKNFIEKQVVPQFVHNIEDTLGNASLKVIDEIKHYLRIYWQNQSINFRPSQYSQPVQTSEQSQKSSSTLAKWPLVFYCLCNSVTLICSVIFHWFYPMSESTSLLIFIEAHKLCRCTDFAGICFLFGFSPIPSIYYGMYCYFQVAQLYLTAMILGALIVFPVSFTDRFQDRAKPGLRVAIYSCFSVLTVVPLTHMTINEVFFNGYNQAFSLANSMPWYILGLVFYGIGGFFYVSHIPNKFSVTGKYDLVGHSHQYWHVMIIAGLMAIYMGCLENYFTRKETGCRVLEF